jgi:CRP/FNR family transcriptional regulator
MALRGLVALVEDLSFRSVRARVAKILLEQEQASVRAETTSDAAPARHRLTQQEIAALAGTAREMVGRALKELEAAGAIHNEHGRITILSDERLRALAM